MGILKLATGSTSASSVANINKFTFSRLLSVFRYSGVIATNMPRVQYRVLGGFAKTDSVATAENLAILEIQLLQRGQLDAWIKRLLHS